MRTAVMHNRLQWVAMVGLTALIGSCSKPPATDTSPTSSTPRVTIVVDGSSTVYPLTDEVAKEFQFERADDIEPNFEVAFSGTTGGFRKFCAGETDISNASRPINEVEMQACKAAGVEYIELPVAFDALTIAVHPDNTWADSLTLDELKRLWEPKAEGAITQWSQIRAGWPDQPIALYGAGGDSGTFDYFTEAVVGETRASRTDYTASEDDTELVRGIRNDPNGLAYFGYAYYEESQTMLKPVAIDSGNGPILPSSETVKSGAYNPLSRPLFIYVSTNSLASKPVLREFVEYYLVNAGNLSKVVGYVPLQEEAYTIALEHLQQNKVGTVFAGKTITNLTLDELLKQEKAF